jgi:SAM-dependent methyltransferase
MNGLERSNELGMQLVAGRRVDKMLDLGCKDGETTMRFAAAAGARETWGVEYVEEFRDLAEEKGIHCVAGDLNCPWPVPGGEFDLVLSSQSIEHMHNTRLYVEECFRCLKPGGQLVVLTENLSSWSNIGALVCGWQPFSCTSMNGWILGNPLTWDLDDPVNPEFLERWNAHGVSGTVGHVRVLSYRALRDVLLKAGFHDVRVMSRGYLPLWGSLSDLLCRADPRHGHFLVATAYRPRDG